jgi:hypothetical protein
MNELPVSVRPAVRRLARRLAIGLFLDVWPAWAVASLVGAGIVALICRAFVPAAAPSLRWLWLAPLLSIIPALVICIRRAYRPADVVALADSLSGGHGLWLALLDTRDPAWAASPVAERGAAFPLPELRLKRTLAVLLPALMFLVTALWLPQRMPRDTSTRLADDMADKLEATLAELKEQDLITPTEENTLDEEIERLRQSARERVDASSWEAADALRESMAANVGEKQNAAKWAEESLSRYMAAASSGRPDAAAMAEAHAAELTKALEKLAQSGMLATAPANVQELLKSGKFPLDEAAQRELMASLAKALAASKGKFTGLGKLGKEFGRFDPAEFPLDATMSAEGGIPGQGDVTRGRADAELTWGKETAPFDRFKEKALPPGAARSPDDWTPVVEAFGAPQESPQMSASSAARQYGAVAGQTAWRRTLAPRHRSAVKKYFEK